MREIDEELKVLNTVRIRADICIDSEKKRILLDIPRKTLYGLMRAFIYK